MSAETNGPARRLTAEQEERAAEHFARGASERQVADALGVGAGTAHRLRDRLAGRITELTALAAADGKPGETTVSAQNEHQAAEPYELTDLPAVDYDAELAELRTLRAGLADVVQTHLGRAEASRAAVRQLELERDETLRANRDAAPFRSRMADARADAEDSEKAAQFAAERLYPVDARIAEIEAAREAAAELAVRQEASRAGDDVAPQIASALREAVDGDGTVRALADLGARLAQAEAVAGRSWEAVVLPPLMPGMGNDDVWHRAVRDLLAAAKRGDVAACQAAIPGCAPWEDRDLGELATMEAALIAEANRLQRLTMDNMNRNWRARTGAPEAWARPDTSQVNLDANGREVWQGYRPPIPAGPRDHMFGLGNR